MSNAFDIAICGAGPVGTVLALLLARSCPNARITLFDAESTGAPRVAADPRALAISRSNLWLLQRVLGERFAILPCADIRDVVIHAAFSPSAAAQSSLLIAPHAQLGAVLRYGALLSTLRAAWADACLRLPQRCITHFDCRAEIVSNEPGGATLRVQSGTLQRFDLCLLAEGGLFDSKAPKDWHQRYEQSALVGEALLSGSARGVAYECFGQTGALALLPLPESQERYALVFCLPQAQADLLMTMASSELDAFCAAYLPKGVKIERWNLPLSRFPLGLNAVGRLVLGRVVCLGNAAQTLHPIAGQGLNLGLRDAYGLARGLSAPLDLAQLPDCLSRFERERSRDRAGVILATHSLASSLGRHSDFLDSARRALFAFLQRPFVQRHLASRLMFGWN